jgi:hypothetical protein
VESPSLLCCKSGVVDALAVAWVAVALVEDWTGVVVTDAVEEALVLIVLEVSPSVCAILIAESPLQQSVVSPQHHVSEVRVPSQGVT